LVRLVDLVLQPLELQREIPQLPRRAYPFTVDLDALLERGLSLGVDPVELGPPLRFLGTPQPLLRLGGVAKSSRSSCRVAATMSASTTSRR
jgi:hypothetical protein